MADTGRDQGHLGIDTNVLVAYLDGDHPSHRETSPLSERSVALNPTIIHEAYHTLVFKMKWIPQEASNALADACADSKNRFINQTLRTTKLGLRLATLHNLGGRDALILASFIGGKIPKLVTFDKALIALRTIRQGNAILRVESVKTILSQ